MAPLMYLKLGLLAVVGVCIGVMYWQLRAARADARAQHDSAILMLHDLKTVDAQRAQNAKQEAGQAAATKDAIGAAKQARDARDAAIAKLQGEIAKVTDANLNACLNMQLPPLLLRGLEPNAPGADNR